MGLLNLASVVAGPRLTIGAVTVYSGCVSFVRNSEFRGIVSPTDLEPFAFFVPDSEPYPQQPAKLWLELGLRRVRSLSRLDHLHLGAYEEKAEVVDDPRGGEQRWLRISLQVATYAVQEIDFNYRVTVEP